MRIVFIFSIILVGIYAFPQDKVSFYTSDSLKITADMYLKNVEMPFILLFHQAESSRGEYTEIAPKLMNLGYNCLAVDLRAGKKTNYISNETAERALKQNIPHQFIDAQKDIEAAIKYVRKLNKKPVILFGSSYSASLSLLIAKDYPEDIKAVVAFSPGEFFRPELNIKDEISELKTPVFITGSELEYKYMVEMFSEVPDSTKTFFKPKKGRGVHGAKALWKENPGSNECWLQLSWFFKQLNKF